MVDIMTLILVFILGLCLVLSKFFIDYRLEQQEKDIHELQSDMHRMLEITRDLAREIQEMKNENKN